ncbi:MAG: peptidase [Gemmatimonadetes bacterium]|nr:MAG: peptidase [Gemmatimonadota bacterium]
MIAHARVRPSYVPLSLAAVVRRAAIAAVTCVLAVAPAAAVQTAPAVPQEFDWWAERGVPAVTPWGQAVDTASTRMILSWTTAPEYTTPLVDHLPLDPSVVSPTDHFGHPIGKPGVLHHVEEIYGYMEALAASSPRVRFQRLGETEEGRTLALVQVGSEANLARLGEVREAMNHLADPRTTSPEEAERIIAEMPAIYTFYAGLHSPETGPPEMVMELAYRLAVSDDPVIRRIRDEVVVFIVPVAEPDGRDKVVDWHRRYNADVYDLDDRVPGPPYWGRYIFHDNNRDGLQLSARLTQVLAGLFLEWKYPVGHDLHESVPYLYVSTGTGPYNPTVDPITISEWQWMSNFEVAQLTSYGLPGVWTHNFYTGWYPGYLLWLTNTRNAVGRFYETFGNSIPNTVERELGSRSTSVEWYRPNPPREKTLWSLRNNTNYMETGALTALQLVAENREKVLRNYWRKANNSLRRGRTEAPYAWVVPADQPRRADAAAMLELLLRQGIEVHRAAEDGSFGDVEVHEGDYLIRMDQPYRNFVQTLMERQEFPENAPSPYDDVAWTYPLMFNVTAHAVDEAGVQSLAMAPVVAPVRIAGRVELEGRSGPWAVLPNASAHILAARLALGERPVRVAETEIHVHDERTLPAGTWVLDGDGAEAAARALAERGFDVVRMRDSSLEGVPTHELDMPRVALLHTWSRTQDEGWARYTLDQAGLPYTYVGEDRIGKLGDLRERFDVILFPHQGSRASAKGIFQGVSPEHGPIAYTRTAEFPSHGTPDASDDITGGMGFEGLMALHRFVQDGGTLIAIGSAATIPVEFGFLRDVSLGDVGSMFIPGSILGGTVVDATNPLTYGYGETLPLYHQWGPYLNVPEDRAEGVAVRYARGGDLLLSGVARNAGRLGGQPAVYAEQVGEGWVVIYGFDALHRHQNHGDHALVWNAILNWNDLGAGRDAAADAAVTEGGGGR